MLIYLFPIHTIYIEDMMPSADYIPSFGTNGRC